MPALPPGLAGFLGVVLLLPRPAALLDADRVELLREAVALEEVEAEEEEGEEVEEVLLIVVAVAVLLELELVVGR